MENPKQVVGALEMKWHTPGELAQFRISSIFKHISDALMAHNPHHDYENEVSGFNIVFSLLDSDKVYHLGVWDDLLDDVLFNVLPLSDNVDDATVVVPFRTAGIYYKKPHDVAIELTVNNAVTRTFSFVGNENDTILQLKRQVEKQFLMAEKWQIWSDEKGQMENYTLLGEYGTREITITNGVSSSKPVTKLKVTLQYVSLIPQHLNIYALALLPVKKKRERALSENSPLFERIKIEEFPTSQLNKGSTDKLTQITARPGINLECECSNAQCNSGGRIVAVHLPNVVYTTVYFYQTRLLRCPCCYEDTLTVVGCGFLGIDWIILNALVASPPDNQPTIIQDQLRTLSSIGKSTTSNIYNRITKSTESILKVAKSTSNENGTYSRIDFKAYDLKDVFYINVYAIPRGKQLPPKCLLCFNTRPSNALCMRNAKCTHFQHAECIRKWNTKYSDYCPECEVNTLGNLNDLVNGLTKDDDVTIDTSKTEKITQPSTRNDDKPRVNPNNQPDDFFDPYY